MRGYLGNAKSIADGVIVTFNDYVHPWTQGDWVAVRTPTKDFRFQSHAVEGDCFYSVHEGRRIVFVRKDENSAAIKIDDFDISNLRVVTATPEDEARALLADEPVRQELKRAYKKTLNDNLAELQHKHEPK